MKNLIKPLLVAGLTLLGSVGYAIDYTVEGEVTPFRLSHRVDTLDNFRRVITLRLEADGQHMPPPFSVRFKVPSVDIQAFIPPKGADGQDDPTSIYNFDFSKNIPVSFNNKSYFSSATVSQPLVSFVNENSRNRFSVAGSELVFPTVFQVGEEEAGEIGFLVRINFFKYPTRRTDAYEVKLLIDERPAPINEVQRGIQAWWAAENELVFPEIPRAAYVPYYCTWYAFKADLRQSAVEEQAEEAVALGCKAIIVDDGWQKANNVDGGYFTFNGDWEVNQQKFPDFAAHVDRVQQTGLDYLLWICPSMVGEKTDVYKKFKDQMLYRADWADAWVIDPRHPEVRNYMIERVVRLFKAYGIDGVKIDFMDLINSRYAPKITSCKDQGCDYASVEEATVALLSEVYRQATAVNPDALIEYRQFYTSPVLQQYVTMMRAIDCPNDVQENRVRTLDARGICRTPIHADPLVWNKAEPAAVTARQLIHTFLSVPQISTDIAALPPDHRQMLSFLLRTWDEHSILLTRGTATNYGVDTHYAWSQVHHDGQTALVAYKPEVMTPGHLEDEVLLLNGTYRPYVVLELEKAATKEVRTYDCLGTLVNSQTMTLRPGINSIEIPPSGVVKML